MAMSAATGAPALRTERLELRALDGPLAQAQLDAPDQFFAALGAAAPPAQWPPDPFDDAMLRYVRDQLLGAPRDAGWLAWVFLTSADRVVVGAGGFTGPPDFDGEVELGFGLLPDYQGARLAREAVRALVDWAFAAPEVMRLVAHVTPELGPGGPRLLTELGFVDDGAPPYPGVARYVRRRPM